MEKDNPVEGNPLEDRACLTRQRCRKAAKLLKKQIKAGEKQAIGRFKAVFGSRRDVASAGHADCLHVIAREQGAESWPRLKLMLETASMDVPRRLAVLERALTGGNMWLVRRILSQSPHLAKAHIGIGLALRNVDWVRDELKARPELAAQPVSGRMPLAWLCFSKFEAGRDVRHQDVLALLDLLLARGADINLGIDEDGHNLSPLYGALGHSGDLELARALLERGADPDDDESLYHATELSDLEGLRLMFAHGAEIGRTNAFFRMLDFENPEGVRLFLDYGADPNAPLYQHQRDAVADRRNALHHAIMRGRRAVIGQMLIDAGVDCDARFDSKNCYSLARAWGNREMADLLEQTGHGGVLDAGCRFMDAVMRGNEEEARKLADQAGGVADLLSSRDLARATDLAMDDANLPILRLMHALGFDPDHQGEEGMPPIHTAAWWGQGDLVAFYIAAGVDLEKPNAFGGAALGTAIHGSANCPAREKGKYTRVVCDLLAAGAGILPEQGHLEMGSEEICLIVEEALEGRK